MKANFISYPMKKLSPEGSNSVIREVNKIRSQKQRKLLSVYYDKNMPNKTSDANILIHFSNLGKTGKMLGLRENELGRLRESGNQLYMFFRRLQRHHGARFAIKEIKAMYRESVNLIMGYEATPMTGSWYARSNDDTNYPLCLKKFVPLLRHKKLTVRRLALSQLNFTTVIKLEPVEDIRTLTKPSKGLQGLNSIKEPLKMFLRSSQFTSVVKKSFGLELMRHRDKSVNRGLHSTSKAGIKGPSSLTVGYQTQGITESLEVLLDEFDNIFREDHWGFYFRRAKEYFSLYKDPLLYDWKKNRNYKVRPLSMSLRDQKLFKLYHGKVSFLPAPAGKTRIVMIGNYWVQECFLQMHKVLGRVLSKIPEDGTYNQEQQFDRVNYAASVGPVWSFDLTAATDRFPIQFIILVLNLCYEGLGSLYGQINKELLFTCLGKPMSYSVGQPMGLYGSWPAFALSHHVLIQYAARTVGRVYPFKEYAVLGDDVAIWDEEVALEYERLLVILDVEISYLKSFKPFKGDKGPSSAEFAKRLTFKGVELTPISLEMNTASWDNPVMMPELFHWLKTRSFISINRVPMSRLLRLLNIQDINDRNNFVYQTLVNNIITDSPIKGIHDCVPKENKNRWLSLDSMKILRIRLELSLKRGPESWLTPVKLNSERLHLNKMWSTRTQGVVKAMPHNYYLRQMRLKRMHEMFDLWREITGLQSLDYTSKKAFYHSLAEAQAVAIKEDDIPLGYNNIIEVYQRFEVIPPVSYDELYSSILNTKSLNQLRCEYITKLARTIRIKVNKNIEL